MFFLTNVPNKFLCFWSLSWLTKVVSDIFKNVSKNLSAQWIWPQLGQVLVALQQWSENELRENAIYQSLVRLEHCFMKFLEKFSLIINEVKYYMLFISGAKQEEWPKIMLKGQFFYTCLILMTSCVQKSC
jgi:hypothetical protein